ncbi:hypothetical protein K439DRAFT_1251537, partial [Ramaria rubella]
ARQPRQIAWLRERLLREHAIALGHAIELSTAQTYNSHLQSYLTFCKLHDFPVQPTVDTLSFYVVFMCHHIKPASVSAYLSGIANTLEPYFPNIRDICHNTLTCIACSRNLTLRTMTIRFFLAILFTGFYALMRLGELTQSDSKAKRFSKKTSMHHSVRFVGTRYSFHLPYHKGGATVLALAGVADDVIQAMGRWASDTFRIYIRKHPVILQALIHGGSAFN